MRSGNILVRGAIIYLAGCGGEVLMAKERSAFYPAELVAAARTNAARQAWGRALRQELVAAAQPWLEMSDEQAWALMFGPTIPRSWMVWSSGQCPACRKGVPMYNWEIRALERPWKAVCPHCREIFPKNDFQAFYRSGLDARGIFDPQRAERSLLFNAEHPGASDPLRNFGVDDGKGYAEGGKTWRFIGAYLIYGQWKQAVLGGINKLAAAYVLTGDVQYARKAGILLDRVADLYPDFDFKTQAFLYDAPSAHAGYVSVWHDACEEVRELALAYDQVFEGLRADAGLVTFLAGKARQCQLANPKASFADIQRNIEERIFKDTLAHRPKIQSNQPRTEVAETIIRTVLDWPDNRSEINRLVDGIVKAATAVDGLSGEKGLAAYATIAPRALAELLGRYDRIDPAFLGELFKRQPQLHQTYRFHVDACCLGEYYPQTGDTGTFARKVPVYPAMDWLVPASLSPSGFTFMWRLFELTRDPAFVQVLYRANKNTAAGLPHDLFLADAAALQQGVAEVLAKSGTEPEVDSVHKPQWHLAILRGGRGPGARALWLDYDADGRHCHADGLNLGLFAEGLDLMPDFGYPPVQFGGWENPRARWYRSTAAHNTVVVDGRNQAQAAGRGTLWAAGRQFRAMRAECPNLYGIRRYERTVALVDLSDRDGYAVDIFRVAGGTDQVKFMGSHFGSLAITGLNLAAAADYGDNTLQRNFRMDAAARPGWSADWKIEDRLGYLPAGREVHLRYADFTAGAAAGVCDTWIASGFFNDDREEWIPRVVVRRQAQPGPLASTFAGIIVPYQGECPVAAVRRLALELPDARPAAESDLALEVRPAAGGCDLVFAADVSPAPAARERRIQKDWGLVCDGALGLVRRDAAGGIQRVALCQGSFLGVANIEIRLKTAVEFVEFVFAQGRPELVAGPREQVAEVLVAGQSRWRP